MILNHRTNEKPSREILKKGFRDGHGTYGTDEEHAGVWLSNVPLDGNEGAYGDVLLRVDVRATKREIGVLEWIEEGKGYREFLIRSAWLNPRVSVTVKVDPFRIRTGSSSVKGGRSHQG